MRERDAEREGEKERVKRGEEGGRPEDVENKSKRNKRRNLLSQETLYASVVT